MTRTAARHIPTLALITVSFSLSPALLAAAADADTPQPRTRAGLIALYDFTDADGPLVRDRSGSADPLDLTIEHPDRVRRSTGSLEVIGDTLIRSAGPAHKVTEAVRRTGALTVEAWVRPAATDQAGPARIVTLSLDASRRNVTLGQDNAAYDVRLRTPEAGANGIPSLPSAAGALATDLTHVVFTRNRTGRTRLYLNGRLEAQRIDKTASLANWDDQASLALANELTGGRPWRGTYRLVALYARDLRPWEVERHYIAGPDAPAADTADELAASRLFADRVAPLFAQHCLECHDSSVMKADLDLSKRDAAFRGGSDGPVIVPGDAEVSALWEAVHAEEMPRDRDPLTAEQKQLLRDWIDGGAAWTIDPIDPAVYSHSTDAARHWVRRLTVEEYILTVRDTLGLDIADEARDLLPPDLRADGFSNTAYNLGVDLTHVEAYARLADLIVAQLDLPAFASRFSNKRSLDADTLRPLLLDIGRHLLRRPLDPRQIDLYGGITSTVVGAGGTFDETIGFVLRAMLQSPAFLYRIESQVGDGLPWPADEFEIASRLSYIVWGAPPDAALLEAVENGDLYDRQGLIDHVRRMLDDPRAVEHSKRFIHEWLDLDRLADLRPNPDRFPGWNPDLADDMRQETLRFFEEIVWSQDRPLTDLLNAQVTFATPALARHYGLEPAGEGWRRYDLTGTPSRGGLLTHASTLTVGGDEGSTVTRGLFILHDLLRGVVKDPPPCVDTTPVPVEPGLSARAIAEQRIANKACGACHGRFEPLAFGLGKFDGIGAYHEADEHGNALRDDGVLVVPGEAAPIPFNSSARLMDLLADSDRVRLTFTWKLTQFAVGRPLHADDLPVIDDIHRRAWRQGRGTYRDLITAIVLSDLVLTTPTEMPHASPATQP